MTTTYDVQIWATNRRSGARGTTYRIRWATANRRHSRTFQTRKLAESFKAELTTATRKGEAFDPDTGLPTSMQPKSTGPTWLEHAMNFTDIKWSETAPNHRRNTADGLVMITLALADDDPPNGSELRSALTHWAFNSAARAARPEPPTEYAESLAWIATHSRPLTALEDPAACRDVLAAISRRLDGTPAAASTSNRRRAALSSAIGYAIEQGHLGSNPLARVKVKRRKVVEAIDSRVVLNHEQARAYLAAVRTIAPDMEAFYGCIYYAAMRPGEVRNLKHHDLDLPETGWGTANLSLSYQSEGKTWTDDGKPRGESELKHRALGETRQVPLPPQLVTLLRHHLNTFATGSEGRLFVTRVGPFGHPVAGALGGPVGDGKIGRIHRAARASAFTQQQLNTPLARRPYDLRHAAVSTWLAAGVPPTQVAAWAGHSVTVLLKVYAHAIDGQADQARQRIENLLGHV